MAKAFLEARQLSPVWPHCPLEHPAGTLTELAPTRANVRSHSTEPGIQNQKGCDLEAQMREKRLKWLLSLKWAECK